MTLTNEPETEVFNPPDTAWVHSKGAIHVGPQPPASVKAASLELRRDPIEPDPDSDRDVR